MNMNGFPGWKIKKSTRVSFISNVMIKLCITMCILVSSTDGHILKKQLSLGSWVSNNVFLKNLPVGDICAKCSPCIFIWTIRVKYALIRGPLRYKFETLNFESCILKWHEIAPRTNRAWQTWYSTLKPKNLGTSGLQLYRAFNIARVRWLLFNGKFPRQWQHNADIYL